MKNLLEYLKDYKKECILAPLFKLLEASFELLVPLVMARIIDIGIGNFDKVYIYKMGILLILFVIIGLISAITAQYYSAVLSVGFGTKLRNALFKHILSFSHKEIDILGKDTLLTRLTNDTNQLQTGVNIFFRLILRSPFIVLGALCMSFIISPTMSFIFIFVIISLYYIVFFLMNKSIKLYKLVQSKLDKVLGISDNNLAGVRIIRAFNQGNNEKKEFLKASEELFLEQNRVSKISAIMNPLTYVIVNMGVVLILYKGGFDISVGKLTKGEVVALINYMSQILVELIKTANLLIIISKSSASAKRVNEIFAVKNSLVDGNLDYPINKKIGEEILRFENVSFKYPKSQNEAISNISFSLKEGEILGIIGGTGSGKSTIVNLIPRFYDVSSGEVLLDNKDIREYNISSLRKNIGLVEQKARLFEGSIKDNLSWGNLKAVDEDFYKAIDLVVAEDVLNAKENGLYSNVVSAAKNFSGGQKQRLSIARTLIKKPKILILDDSSSALDYVTDAKLRKNIKEIKNTTIIVSQRVVSVKNSDKILVLDEGKVVGLGKHEELVATCDVYKEICLSQLSAKELGVNEE
jgi:ABC transporter related protein